jgi:hypothetical protein
MPEYNTPPINTSVALTQKDARPTTYFKQWLDVIWRRTGSYADVSMTVANLQTPQYIVGASTALLSAERVGTSTGRIAWDYGTSGQAKLDLVADSVTYSYIQNVSATDRLLGRSSVGAGDIEEITCTAAGRALLDDANAAAQRTTLGLGTAATAATGDFEASGAVATHAAITSSVHGITAFGASLVDDVNAAAGRTTLGLGTLSTLDAVTNSYTISNETLTRTLDADDAAGSITNPPTQGEVENIRDALLVLADVVGTLIEDLKAKGIVG